MKKFILYLQEKCSKLGFVMSLVTAIVALIIVTVIQIRHHGNFFPYGGWLLIPMAIGYFIGMSVLTAFISYIVKMANKEGVNFHNS